VNENPSKSGWNGAPPRLLSIEEAAAVLNVPKGWLAGAVTERKVPFTKIGKHVRFSRAHIEKIIRAGEIAPTAEPAVDRGTARTRL